MQQYLDLLTQIIEEGREKESGRDNMPNTIGISSSSIKMDLKDGFPLLTTKKMYWKGIVHELLWFLRGETSIKYLVDNNVNIWNGDAYRWYLKTWEQYKDTFTSENGLDFQQPWSFDNFIDLIKKGELWQTAIHSDYILGDLGKIYGYQWRNQNGVDQVKDVVDGLRDNPYSRYHIIDGWNKSDFTEMALPPCHLLYHFIVMPLTLKERYNVLKNSVSYDEWTEKHYTKPKTHEYFDLHNIPKFYLDLNMYQRSVDTPLGSPYNLASMSLLLMLIAKASNMIPNIATWLGGDTHIYVNQLDGVKEQLSRQPMKLPTMKINKELNCLDDILSLTIDDFELVDYVSHPAIKFELSVGLKKA